MRPGSRPGMRPASGSQVMHPCERDLFIDNLLVRIHPIIEMIPHLIIEMIGRIPGSRPGMRPALGNQVVHPPRLETLSEIDGGEADQKSTEHFLVTCSALAYEC